jgi:flagellar hook assembly protein FlgD
MSAGTHRIMWRGEDRAGANVASGVYFLRMVAGKRVFRERLTLLR